MSALDSHHKVQEILRKSHGQNKLAEQAVQQLVAKDHAFLLGLVEPFLGGIIAHALDRARKGPAPKPAETAAPAKRAAASGLPARGVKLGTGEPLPKKIIKARTSPSSLTSTPTLAGGKLDDVVDRMAQQFEATPVTTPTTSEQHVNTLRSLAKKQFGKREE